MITVKHISKSYGDTKALRDVSLEVRPGELFGLIGPDGAGKTTLMRIILTLLLPDSGSATIDGYDVVSDYKKIRKIAGYMAGRFSLYQDLTVEENLKFYASVFGTSITENYFLIKDIYSHIEPFKKRRAGKLSGGMKQKLALSCALIHKPRILVLDEPTTGVDAVSRREFWEMLKKLQEQGITILVSTPYMDEAKLCNRVALIQKGEIMKIDTPESIANNYGRKVLSVKTSARYQLVNDLRKHPEAESAYAFGDAVHFVSAGDITGISDLEVYLSEHGHQEIQVKQIAPGIEDVFIGLSQQ